MRRCAFLTMADPAGYVMDDELAVSPLAERGVRVDFVAWDQAGIDWHGFDGVVVRSTWDYPAHPDRFLSVLGAIPVPLANPLPVLRWNLDKRYLLTLGQLAVPTVPTRLVPDLTNLDGMRYPVVIKPCIGANAAGIEVLGDADSRPRARADEGPWLLQPFVDTITGAGERSLFFFDRVFSHAICKRPAPGDFRVQEEHGGVLSRIAPSPEDLAVARSALAAVPGRLLYARVDVVTFERQSVLMELELIEPSLYLRMDDAAPERFADVVADWLTS